MSLIHLPVELNVVSKLNFNELRCLKDERPDHIQWLKEQLISKIGQGIEFRSKIHALTRLDMNVLLDVLYCLEVFNESKCGYHHIQFVNTFINKEKYRISSDNATGKNKVTFVLYCCVNLDLIESILKEATICGKKVNMTNIFCSGVVDNAITFYRTNYNTPVADTSNNTKSDFTMRTYTFI